MHAELMRVRWLVAAALVLSASQPLRAQAISGPPSRVPLEFDKREVMIPMRDGVRLHTLIFTQKGVAEPRPIILNRTPYGIANTGRALNTAYPSLQTKATFSSSRTFAGVLRRKGSSSCCARLAIAE